MHESMNFGSGDLTYSVVRNRIDCGQVRSRLAQAIIYRTHLEIPPFRRGNDYGVIVVDADVMSHMYHHVSPISERERDLWMRVGTVSRILLPRFNRRLLTAKLHYLYCIIYLYM
jgi:hypothetical protein